MSMFWLDTTLGVAGVTVTTSLVLWAIFRSPHDRTSETTTQQTLQPQRSLEATSDVAASAPVGLRQPVS